MTTTKEIINGAIGHQSFGPQLPLVGPTDGKPPDDIINKTSIVDMIPKFTESSSKESRGEGNGDGGKWRWWDHGDGV